MNVEGLWCFQSGSNDNPGTFLAGGVVVLETGRALGGDSVFAYIGDYIIEGGQLRASIRLYQWNLAAGDVENVFGMKGPNIDYMVNVVGRREGNMIIGHISPAEHPDFQLPIRLLHIADLPG